MKKNHKRIISLLLVLVIFLTAGCSSKPSDGVARPSRSGQLQVLNGQLCDKNGNPVQLKGVSTHSIVRSGRFIVEECFKEISEQWKVNVVRLAMYTEANDSYLKSDYYRQNNLDLVTAGIELARKYDMYAIIDWHILSDGNPNKYLEESKAFFAQMSAKYADYENVIYEICNEPNGNDVSWPVIKAYAEQIIPVIRANAPKALIIVGTPNWSQRIDQAAEDPLAYDNIMYTLHFYSATHKDELRALLRNACTSKFPVFVTEYGVCASSGGLPRDLPEADKWMDLLDEFGISSCIWSFSKAPEAASLISSNTLKTSGFTDEDLTETGRWFVEMLKKTYEK